MLFANELASLQTEIATFEAIITAKRQQIQQFNQAQIVASTALEAVQNAIAHIEQLAPKALAPLKSSLDLRLIVGSKMPCLQPTFSISKYT